MTLDIKHMAKEALEADSREFINTVKEAAELMRAEEGQVGDMTIHGRLVRLKPQGEALIISDLHGDLESLIRIFHESSYIQAMKENKDALAIFLGDYGDRGAYSAEVYYVVLRLKLLFPEQVILLRGNHEGPDDLSVYPYDLPVQFQKRFGKDWHNVHDEVRRLFNNLYNAVIVDERCLLIHGGPPPMLKGPEDLAYAHKRHPEESLLEDILWSDPYEMAEGVYNSPRGAGKLFSEEVTLNALKRLNVAAIIRGHEPCPEGFKLNHGSRVLTIFSRKGHPYYNLHGAYLRLNLAQKFKNAEELTPYIHKF
ncbi:metallophosphoesterase [Candidatus Bathyarchaeota archaeon]|nr:metallophosphoesterase [Candidatus Bathyarchaeota archaeon]